jgi:glycosyltransferase involved in cell wall biosynthesis
MKISFILICKDETDQLIALLESIKPIGLYEIVCSWTGTNPETKKILDKYHVKTMYFKWTDSFSDARNKAWERATGDYIMWLDADDVLINPKAFKCELRKGIRKGYTAFFIPYRYRYDEDGTCICVINRERVVINKKSRFEGALVDSIIDRDVWKVYNMKDTYIHHNYKITYDSSKFERNYRMAKKDWQINRNAGSAYY